MRPQVVCGFALGSPMNMLSALGVLAAIQRERGEPLRFPGGAPCITQATDADLLARAIVWAAEDPACANETFNIANGDVMVWQEIFRWLPRCSACRWRIRRPSGSRMRCPHTSRFGRRSCNDTSSRRTRCRS
jgi:nucleoside-diphosphate-sugar epimerase